jgi:hypothetical protein
MRISRESNNKSTGYMVNYGKNVERRGGRGRGWENKDK